jgi:DNA-binding transcriptional MocR family regulator
MSYRYAMLASEFESAIKKGVFPAGTRLPSIRKSCARYGVSMSTVMEAYGRLEERGLIEARPKSGYFVKPPARARQPLDQTRPRRQPGEVNVGRLAMDVLAATSRPGMIPLGAGVPDESMLPITALARAYSRAARVNFRAAAGYIGPNGVAVLREAVSRLLVESGCRECADDIVIANGGQEALMLALRAVTSPNDIVAVESPTYFGVLQALEALGLRALELPTDAIDGIDLDALEAAAQKGGIAACVLMPTYQNPLGFRMSDAAKQRAVEILARYKVTLIEDDIFGALGTETPRPLVAKSFDDAGDVILCGSFSKTVSPALRLGWLAPGRHLEEILHQKFLINIATATIPQLALADFLVGNRFRRATQTAARTYAQRTHLMREAVLRHFPEGTNCSTPVGGFLLWVEMPEPCRTMALYEKALEDGITFAPGRLFTRAASNDRSLRINCAAIEADDIDGVISRLGALAMQSRG